MGSRGGRAGELLGVLLVPAVMGMGGSVGPPGIAGRRSRGGEQPGGAVPRRATGGVAGCACGGAEHILQINTRSEQQNKNTQPQTITNKQLQINNQ